TSTVVSGCLGSEETIPDEFYGDDIYPSVAVEPFVLIDENGENFSSEEFDDKVVIYVFMFTRCPDVCPIVSANVKWLYGQLSESEQANVEVVSITVDPWTDNSTELALYMESMGLDWHHLTGDIEVLESVWGNFDVGLKTVASDEYGSQNSTNNSEGSEPAGNSENTTGSDESGGRSSEDTTTGRHHPEIDYLVDHSTGTILVDRDGHQRVWWGDTDWIPDLVLEDVRELIDS
ncbi:MAG: SCO family protein, partial [Euryarchaeota archaeon]|nr:SCO family protein [Euryarchaeota archaeon]